MHLVSRVSRLGESAEKVEGRGPVQVELQRRENVLLHLENLVFAVRAVADVDKVIALRGWTRVSHERAMSEQERVG